MAIPCCAFDECNDANTTTSPTKEEHKDDCAGVCSPFFNCNGCNISAFTPATNVQTPQLNIIPEQQSYSRYTAYIPSPNSESIWQPPRAIGLL